MRLPSPLLDTIHFTMRRSQPVIPDPEENLALDVSFGDVFFFYDIDTTRSEEPANVIEVLDQISYEYIMPYNQQKREQKTV